MSKSEALHFPGDCVCIYADILYKCPAYIK